MENVSYGIDNGVDLVLEKRGPVKILLDIFSFLSTHLNSALKQQCRIQPFIDLFGFWTRNDVTCKFWGWKMVKWNRKKIVSPDETKRKH